MTCRSSSRGEGALSSPIPPWEWLQPWVDLSGIPLGAHHRGPTAPSPHPFTSPCVCLLLGTHPQGTWQGQSLGTMSAGLGRAWGYLSRGTGKVHTSPLEVLREHLVGGGPQQQEVSLALLCSDGTGSLEPGMREPCSSQQEELMADLKPDGQIDRCTEAGRAVGCGGGFCWLRMRGREWRKRLYFRRPAVLPACCGCYGAPGTEGASQLWRDPLGWG